MTPIQITILVVAIVVIVALLAFAFMANRRRALRQKFGPEYDRVVAERHSHSAAQRELRERERKHAELELRPLSDESRNRYAQEWAAVQARFVDSPEEAVRAGDDLVTRLIGEVGYPTDNYDEQLATLSVEHARTLGHYRDEHDIFLRNERGEASTEQLRQALVHYRALFADVLGTDPVAAVTGPDGSSRTEPAEPAERRAEAAERPADAPPAPEPADRAVEDAARTEPVDDAARPEPERHHTPNR
jgi:hypothetical protein